MLERTTRELSANVFVDAVAVVAFVAFVDVVAIVVVLVVVLVFVINSLVNMFFVFVEDLDDTINADFVACRTSTREESCDGGGTDDAKFGLDTEGAILDGEDAFALDRFGLDAFVGSFLSGRGIRLLLRGGIDKLVKAIGGEGEVSCRTCGGFDFGSSRVVSRTWSHLITPS